MLHAVRFAMNTAIILSTGHSPAYLFFGRVLRTPNDVYQNQGTVTKNENFVAEIAPYLRKIADTLHQTRETHESHQDRCKVYAD